MAVGIVEELRLADYEGLGLLDKFLVVHVVEVKVLLVHRAALPHVLAGRHALRL